MLSYIFLAASATLPLLIAHVAAQQNCYYGPGAGFRGPSELVACNTSSTTLACCLSGDTCLSGNACYNYATGNTYQYGCTDINYEDESCPKKCGWDPAKSPWIGLSYCSDLQDLDNHWTCLAPESCGCEWEGSYALQILPSRACGAMGSEARIALYAPSTLLPYVSLPSTVGGSTGYYSTTTDDNGEFSIIETAIAGYTPDAFTQFTQYRDVPQQVQYINPGATASPSTQSAAYIYTDTTPPAPPVAPTSSAAQSSAAATSSTLSKTRSSAADVSTATTTPSPAPAPSGLSTGAKIGIGVGVAGGVCLFATVGICWFLLARRRKNKPEAQAPPLYPQNPPMGPYMHGQQPSGWAPFPPNGMPYYVVPAISQKDAGSLTTSPAYSPPHSPPHSPPPPMELSTEHRHYSQGNSTLAPAASPELAPTTHSEVSSARYA